MMSRPPTRHGIFVSYRRGDRGDLVERLYDRLEEHFGVQSVFIDVDGIPPGVNFLEHVDAAAHRRAPGQNSSVLVGAIAVLPLENLSVIHRRSIFRTA